MEAAVLVQDVVTRFDAQVVHAGVSFAVPRGEVVALIGGSGSGKSRAAAGDHRIGPPDVRAHRAARHLRLEFPRRRAQRGPAPFRHAVPGRRAVLIAHRGPERGGPVPRAHDASHWSVDSPARELQDRPGRGLPADAARKSPSQLSGGMRSAPRSRAPSRLNPSPLPRRADVGPRPGRRARLPPPGARARRWGWDSPCSWSTHDVDLLTSIVDRAVVLGAGKVIAEGPVERVRAVDHPWLRRYFSGGRLMEPDARYTLVGAAVLVLFGAVGRRDCLGAQHRPGRGRAAVQDLFRAPVSPGAAAARRRHHARREDRVDRELSLLAAAQPRGRGLHRRGPAGARAHRYARRRRPQHADGPGALQLVSAREDSPLLTEAPSGEPCPVIAEGESEQEHISQSLDQLVRRADAAFREVGATLSQGNRAALEQSLRNVRDATRPRRCDVGQGRRGVRCAARGRRRRLSRRAARSTTTHAGSPGATTSWASRPRATAVANARIRPTGRGCGRVGRAARRRGDRDRRRRSARYGPCHPIGRRFGRKHGGPAARSPAGHLRAGRRRAGSRGGQAMRQVMVLALTAWLAGCAVMGERQPQRYYLLEPRSAAAAPQGGAITPARTTAATLRHAGHRLQPLARARAATTSSATGRNGPQRVIQGELAARYPPGHGAYILATHLVEMYPTTHAAAPGVSRISVTAELHRARESHPGRAPHVHARGTGPIARRRGRGGGLRARPRDRCSTTSSSGRIAKPPVSKGAQQAIPDADRGIANRFRPRLAVRALPTMAHQ